MWVCGCVHIAHSPSLPPPQNVQMFMSTPLSRFALECHLSASQYIITTCQRHSQLRDELYCQLLRQLTGDLDEHSRPLQQVKYCPPLPAALRGTLSVPVPTGVVSAVPCDPNVPPTPTAGLVVPNGRTPAYLGQLPPPVHRVCPALPGHS